MKMVSCNSVKVAFLNNNCKKNKDKFLEFNFFGKSSEIVGIFSVIGPSLRNLPHIQPISNHLYLLNLYHPVCDIFYHLFQDNLVDSSLPLSLFQNARLDIFGGKKQKSHINNILYAHGPETGII